MSALTRAIEGRNAPSDPTPPLHTGDIAYDAIGEVWLYQPVDFRGPIELVPAAKIGGGGADVSPTPPDNPSDGDLWWNTAGSPDQLYISVGGVWQPVVTPTDLSGVLHLTGGTLTGNLNGTTAVFSGDVNSASIHSTEIYASDNVQATNFVSAGVAMFSPNFTSTGLVRISGTGGAGTIQWDNAGVVEAQLVADPTSNRLSIRNSSSNNIATFNWASNLTQFWGNVALNSLPTTNPGSNQVWTGSNGALIVGAGPAGGGFLPLGGGTLTGNLILSGTTAINWSNTVYIKYGSPSNSLAFFKNDNSTTMFTMNGSNGGWSFTTGGGFTQAVTFNSIANFTSLAGSVFLGNYWNYYGANTVRAGCVDNSGEFKVQGGVTPFTTGFGASSAGATVYGVLKLPGIATADPHVAGQVWSNAGSLYISAG